MALYTRVMADLQRAAEQLRAGDLAAASAGLSFGGVTAMIEEAERVNDG